MRKLLTLIFALAAVLFTSAAFAQEFKVSSKDLGKNFGAAYHADNFGCKGDNISPALAWVNAPKGTAAFAVIMFDGDARGGVGFWHWLAYNIPADVNGLARGAGNPATGLLPNGALMARNDAFAHGYTGPCPPPGEKHLYKITVYALKKIITIPPAATPVQAAKIIADNSIGSAVISAHAKQ